MVRDGPMWLQQQGRQAAGQTGKPTDKGVELAGSKDSKRISADAPSLLCFYAKLAVSDSVNRRQAGRQQPMGVAPGAAVAGAVPTEAVAAGPYVALGRLGLVIFSWHNKEFTIIACKSPAKT